MAVQSVNKRFTASVRGLVTEGNELSSPEHSNLAESNYELLHDGTRRRRRPMLQESADPSRWRPVDEGEAVSAHLWRTPAREEDVSIMVEESGGIIRFYWLDHNNLAYISDFPMTNEIDLRLWGRYSADGVLGGNNPAFNFNNPSTYTEGNGSLYIFNQNTGTIKVDLIDRVGMRLRFTPVGTWVRDYEGADETFDLYTRTDRNDALSGFNGQPLLDPDYIDGVHEDLPNNRAYNLSNMGWPGREIARFGLESGDDYTVNQGGYNNVSITYLDNPHEYPAFMDRYLDGRIIKENGQDTFSIQQIKEAPVRRGEPTKGARIMHSDYSVAGTLHSVPIEVEARIVNPNPLNDTVNIEVTFDEPFVHSLGRDIRDTAVFAHYFIFECVRNSDGKTLTGGMSGVFDVLNISADGKVVNFLVENGNFQDYGFFRLIKMYAHPSPVYTPHQLGSNYAKGYDYRNSRRPSAGVFFAGRLWQFGDEHNRLYFSQLIHESTQGRQDFDIQRESMCYMENSPTDADDNQIVATDGGYVTVSDSGTHLQGEVLLGSLLITTDSGIWEIKPTDRSGIFRPDAFSVRRLTTSEVLGHKAMVSVGYEVHVATNEGVVRIFPDERTGVLKTAVMTNDTIKSEYDQLISENTRNVIGAYDPDSRVVRWAFPLEGVYTSTNNDSASPMLSYSLQHNAWFRYDFGFGAAIADMIVLPYTVRNPTYNRFRYLVTALNFIPVIDGDLGMEWAIEAELGPEGPNEWVQFHDPGALFADFMDVFTEPQPRVPPEAFMLTNHHVYGDGQRWTHLNYVTAFNREVATNWVVTSTDPVSGEAMSYRANVNGSTLLSVHWDWFGGEGRNKHTRTQETYRYRRSFFPSINLGEDNPLQNRDEDLLVSKQKVPGKGREFRLRWSSSDHNDSHIVGWALEGLMQTTI